MRPRHFRENKKLCDAVYPKILFYNNFAPSAHLTTSIPDSLPYQTSTPAAHRLRTGSTPAQRHGTVWRQDPLHRIDYRFGRGRRALEGRGSPFSSPLVRSFPLSGTPAATNKQSEHFRGVRLMADGRIGTITSRSSLGSRASLERTPNQR